MGVHVQDAGAFHSPGAGAGRFREPFLVDVPVEARALAISQNAGGQVSGVVVGVFNVYGGHSEDHDLLFELLVDHNVVDGVWWLIIIDVARSEEHTSELQSPMYL